MERYDELMAEIENLRRELADAKQMQETLRKRTFRLECLIESGLSLQLRHYPLERY